MTGLKKGLIIFGILLLFSLGLFVLVTLSSYTEYSVESRVEAGDDSVQKSVDFSENILRYTNDGAFFTDDNGSLVWSVTYEMDAPAFCRAGDTFILYDDGGMDYILFDRNGKIDEEKTVKPIIKADVSENGVVALLMQEDNTGYASLLDKRGNEIASGEFHAENNGFPIDMALSNDGRLLSVSLLQIKDKAVNTVINFYDFGTAGKDAIDNLVASFSYSNMVVPDIYFFSKDRAIAFGDTEFMVYDTSQKPKVLSEIFLSSEVKSVFYNENGFGAISGETTEDGKYESIIRVYNKNGRKRFEKGIDMSYKEISLLNNNEIFMTDGKDAILFSRFGVERFKYTFDGTIYNIFPRKGQRRYVFIGSAGIENVRLEKQ